MFTSTTGEKMFKRLLYSYTANWTLSLIWTSDSYTLLTFGKSSPRVILTEYQHSLENSGAAEETVILAQVPPLEAS